MEDENFRCGKCFKIKEIRFLPKIDNLFCFSYCECKNYKKESFDNIMNSFKNNILNKKIYEINCFKCKTQFNDISKIYINLNDKAFYCEKCQQHFNNIINLLYIDTHCRIHKNKKSDLYCKTCKKEICENCFDNCEKEGHYIINYKEEYKSDKIEKIINDFEKNSILIFEHNESIKNKYIEDYKKKVYNIIDFYNKNKKINESIISMIKVMIKNYRKSKENLNYRLISNIINNCYIIKPKLNDKVPTDRELLNYYSNNFIINKFNKEFSSKYYISEKSATNLINITQKLYAVSYDNTIIKIYNQNFKLIDEIQHKSLNYENEKIKNIFRIYKRNQFISYSKSLLILWNSENYNNCIKKEDFEIIDCILLADNYISILTKSSLIIYKIKNEEIQIHHTFDLTQSDFYSKIISINNNLLLFYRNQKPNKINFKKIDNNYKNLELLPYSLSSVTRIYNLGENKIGFSNIIDNSFMIFDCNTFQIIIKIKLDLFNYCILLNYRNNLYLSKNLFGIYKLDINTLDIIDRLINFDFPYDYDYNPPSVINFQMLENGFLAVIYRKEIRILSS